VLGGSCQYRCKLTKPPQQLGVMSGLRGERSQLRLSFDTSGGASVLWQDSGFTSRMTMMMYFVK
jgi:hypothetical protein